MSHRASLFFSDWGQSDLLRLHNVLPLRTLAENKQISLISPVCLCFLLTLMFTFSHICHLVLCFSMGWNTLSGWLEVTTEHVDIREQKSIYCVCSVVSVCVRVWWYHEHAAGPLQWKVVPAACLPSPRSACLSASGGPEAADLHTAAWNHMKKRSKSGKSEVLWKLK